MKITVAIPTIAGRTRYLAKAIATCTAEPDADLEILVSDNSSGDAESLVRSISDPRVRYIRPPSFLPMAAHWDFVLDNVSGESLTIIGDDDGVMPGGIAAVAALHREHGNILIHHPLANYCWDDHPDAESRNTVTFLHEPSPIGGWKSSAGFLSDIASGAANYFDGPMIYHNFVPMPLVRRIANGGSFFSRAIPDVYSALAFAANSDRYFSCGTMLTLAGQGAKSNGALVSQGKSDGSTFSMASVALHRPRFASRSVSLLLLDSLLEVVERFDPALGSRIAMPDFFVNALREAQLMPGAAPKLREFAAILSGARRHGIASEVVRRAVAALVRREAGKGDASQQPVAGPRRLQLDASVTDISGAAMAVSTYLAGCRTPDET